MQLLDPITQSLIVDNVSIKSVLHCCKELIEYEKLTRNSLDADATMISLKVKDLDIQIRDNGFGFIPTADYATSKIKTFDDIESVKSFGFRGQALHAITTLSKKVTITSADRSKAGNETNLIGQKSELTSSKFAKQIVVAKDTFIKIDKLFNSLPARKQYQKTKNQQKIILELIKKYSILIKILLDKLSKTI
jgi:DNA mismatch repair ATPase MutL